MKGCQNCSGVPPLAGWLQFLLYFGTEAGCWRAREGTFVCILKAVIACWSQLKLSSSYSSVSVLETVFFSSVFGLIIWCGCYLYYVWICTQWVYSRDLEAIFVKNEFSCHQGQSHALWIIPLPSLLSTVHTRVVKEARLHNTQLARMSPDSTVV